MSIPNKSIFLFFALALLGISGCVSTPPEATFVQTPAPETRIDKNDTVRVEVTSDSSVNLIRSEADRLKERILQKIEIEKANGTETGVSKSYLVEVLIEEYERGNAFARFMLAGLGKIRIRGHATVYELPQRKKTAEFDLAKSFAWGGIYGASTRIEDVEPAFAEGIAKAVTNPAEVKRPELDE